MRITFLHPDLGIGGAERLVVDAAVALQQSGHHVEFITAHHNAGHAFPETTDGTLKVTAVGDWLPRSILGRCYALCAYIRMIFLAVYCCRHCGPDLVFCDQISACIPVLRLFCKRAKVLFYCHFPDQLLTKGETVAKRFYRYPLDWLEEWSTGLAHCVCVNSFFTAGVFRETFTSLRSLQLEILYPTLNTALYDSKEHETALPEHLIPARVHHVFLSINRFERKKNIELAVQAYAELRFIISLEALDRCHLVIAGGYDPDNQENIEYFDELRYLATALHLDEGKDVTFVKSPSDAVKRALFEKAFVVIYTPNKEHFGIVPVEAMYCMCPVVAVHSGGPKETVVDGHTGLLTNDDAESFAKCMAELVWDDDKATKMGQNGRQRVIENFSFAAFRDKLNKLCGTLVEQ